MLISKTPLRISLFGGGTDYPDYYSKNFGAVLGCTINHYIFVSVKPLLPFFSHKIKIGYSQTELVRNVEDIKHPSAKNCLIHENLDNLEIQIFSDLPAGTGLGSSSACTVGLLNALNVLKGKKLSKKELANKACYIEQEMINENVGSQDQYHAAFGGFNIIEFSKDDISVRPAQITNEKMKFLEENMLIFYTGIRRRASNILKEQMEKTKKNVNDSHLKKMHDMVFEAEEIIANNESNNMLIKLGNLLHESWEYKKRLSSKISNSFIDEIYEVAKKEGAYGGKLLGAGNGGFLALIAPQEKHQAIKNMINLLNVNFSFENEGSSIIYKKD